jgi:hypothetical protein
MDKAIQEKLTRISDEELDACFRSVFNSPDGQLVLEDLKNRGFYFISTIPVDVQGNTVIPIDPSAVIMHEGMKKLLLYIDTRLMPKQDVEVQSDTQA